MKVIVLSLRDTLSQRHVFEDVVCGAVELSNYYKQ